MTELSQIKYSIIIPVKEINDYALENVNKIKLENRDDVEIIILPNNVTAKIPGAILISTGKVGPGKKRDVGALKASGEWLVFLDDDSYPSEGYFSILDDLIRLNEKYSAFGGPGVTPPENNFWQRVSGSVFLSKYSGGAPERYISQDPAREVNDWPSVNFVINRNTFIKVGGFNTEYWPGEDTLLCNKLAHSGSKILYEPSLVVWHHRREGLLRHVLQVWGYGLHRGHFIKIGIENSKNLKYSIPSAFSIYLLIIFPIFIYRGNYIFLVPLIVYILALFAAFYEIVKIENYKVAIGAIPYILVTHFTYGISYLLGISKNKLESRLR